MLDVSQHRTRVPETSRRRRLTSANRLEDARLQTALFPPTTTAPRPCKENLDYAQIQQQLRTHPHVTLQLLWEEYHASNPGGYRYSRYCEIYQRW